MLVCNVSLRPPRASIAAVIAEAVTAADTTASENIFAALIDDPASAIEIVDAYRGEIMLEAASASDTISTGSDYTATLNETATAADTQSATVPSLGPPLDAVASVTGAWSLSRNMLTAFGAGTRYTKTGTAITSLEDQSGFGRYFSDVATVSRRPTETTAFPASVLCADFSGLGTNNMNSSIALSNFITASSGAIVVSVIVDAISSNNANSYNNDAIIGDGGVYVGLYARNLSGVTFYAYNWDGSEDAPSTTGSVGTAYVIMWRHHGGNVYVSVNGGTEVSVASGNTQVMTGPLLLGGNGAGSGCNCKIAEAFTTSDGSQTAALATAIANMKTYIGA